MPFWTGSRVEQALGVSVASDLTFTGVATDTRTLVPGALFVALVGERYDAHQFLERAKASGARAAVVRHGTPPTDRLEQIEVADTLVALGQLATARRRSVTGPVVAVTGTNGKTTIKEFLTSMLRTRWNVHATAGNQNNLVGVPLTILSAPEECEALVVEAGSSEPGEIARLRDIVEPSIAVVSNVSAGHLTGLENIEGVLREKTALLVDAPVAVVGTEPPALAERSRQVAKRVLVAGLSDAADLKPTRWGVHDDGRGWCVVRGVEFELPIVGRHQLENVMIAVGVALELGLELSQVASAVLEVRLPSGRCEVIRQGDLTILLDAYNANPSSVAALLATAQTMRAGRPLVVMLGSMLELGREHAQLHQQVADLVMETSPKMVAVMGEFVPAFQRYRDALGPALITAADPLALGRALAPRLSGRELVVVKGSRGVALECALPPLLSSDGTPCSTTS